MKSRKADSFFIVIFELLNLSYFMTMTVQKRLEEELRKIIDPLRIRVIEVTTKMGKNGLNIKAVIDKDGGVSLRDCEKVTRLFNDRLDILKIVEEENYNLQVSSPGIQREFKDKREYNLFKSRNVKVMLKEPINSGFKDNVMTGTLEGIDRDIVTLVVCGQKIRIPLERIRKTKLDG